MTGQAYCIHTTIILYALFGTSRKNGTMCLIFCWCRTSERWASDLSGCIAGFRIEDAEINQIEWRSLLSAFASVYLGALGPRGYLILHALCQLLGIRCGGVTEGGYIASYELKC
jgi:hypothetical protein